VTLTAAQIEQRAGKVTCSLASSILGEGQFGSPLVAWAKITGRATEDISQEPYIRAGNYLEPVVCQWWMDDFAQGRELVVPDCGTVAHRDHPWLVGTPDRFIHRDGVRIGIFEAKTANAFALAEWEHGAIPLGYQIQLQLYLEIFDLDVGAFGALVGGQRFFAADVVRDRAFAAVAIERLREWYELHVVQDVQPEPTGRGCDMRQLLRLHPEDTGEIVKLSAVAVEAVRKCRELAESIDAVEEERERCKNVVRACIGDATFGEGACGRVSWKRNAKGTRVLLLK
jgi:predicted phage-related endonuclease